MSLEDLNEWWRQELNGRLLIVAPSSVEQQLSWLQLQAPRQGMRPRQLTISTQRQDLVVSTAADPRILCELAWGNGRAPLRAIIDVGQVCTVPATSLTATVILPATTGAGSYALGIMISEATGTGVPICPTLTDVRRTTGMGGTTAAWAVPPLAAEVTIASNQNVAAAPIANRVRWYSDTAATVAYLEHITTLQSPQSDWIQVPRGARAMDIVNGAGEAAFQPIWHISL